MLGRMISMTTRETTVINFAKYFLFRIPGVPKDIQIVLDKENGHVQIYNKKIDLSRNEQCDSKSRSARDFCEME
jgi:hypothetical protein